MQSLTYPAARRGGPLANSTMAEGLGWLSLALGLGAVLQSRSLSEAIGLDSHPGMVRMVGGRELLAAYGLFSAEDPTPWLWSRVAGDVMDLALLGAAATQRPRRTRALTAFGVVAAVTALDVYAGLTVTRSRQAQRQHDSTKSRIGAGPRTLRASAEGVIDASIVVNKSPEECYRLWRKLEQIPRFMPLLRSVSETDSKRSHWVLEAPSGVHIEWDVELTHDEPGKRIAWRSFANPKLASAGVVRFNPGPASRGTTVRLISHYKVLPDFGGPRSLRKALEHPPRSRVREDLRRFKQLIETGEVSTTEGQPHGPRSMLGKTLERWSLA